jgi:hypothetical protein
MAGKWVRSSTCSSNSCIEAAATNEGHIIMHDSGDELMGQLINRLIVTTESFRAFAEGVKRGDFDSLL